MNRHHCAEPNRAASTLKHYTCTLQQHHLTPMHCFMAHLKAAHRTLGPHTRIKTTLHYEADVYCYMHLHCVNICAKIAQLKPQAELLLD